MSTDEGSPDVPDHLGRSGRTLEIAAGKPIVPVRGSGATVETETGDTYIDYVLNHGSLLHGHAHPEIVEAVTDQSRKGTIYYPSDRTAQRLGTKIIEAVPCGEDLVFTSTGTEATYLALRLARAYTGRSKLLKFGGAYHGWHDYVLQGTAWGWDDSPVERATTKKSIDSAGIPNETASQTLIAPFNDLDRTQEVITENADDLAAVIVEPCLKLLLPVDGFLSSLRRLCDENDTVLIFDEVMTGFRLAYGGAQARYGVIPDLAAYGKAIGGGLPIGAVCGSEDLLSLEDTEHHTDGVFAGGTHRHNAACAAAGIASLDILRQPGCFDRLYEYTETLRDAIEEIIRDASLPCTTLGAGPLFNYSITEEQAFTKWEDKFAGDIDTQEAIDRELLNHGILTKTGTSMRYVSTQHQDADLEATIEAFKSAVEAAT